MVLRSTAVLRTIDRGAPDGRREPWRESPHTFLKVYVPLAIPGLVAGSVCVFVLSLGSSSTPELLGPLQQPDVAADRDPRPSPLAFGRAGATSAILLAGNRPGAGRRSHFRRRARTHISMAASSDPMMFPAYVGWPWSLRPARRCRARRPDHGGSSLVVIPMSFAGVASFQFPPTSWSTQWYQEFFNTSAWYSSLGTQSLVADRRHRDRDNPRHRCRARIGPRHGTRSAASFQPMILSPMIVPTVVAAIGIYRVYLIWHPTGTLTGFIAAHTCLAIPLVVVTVSATLRTVDPKLETAAASLGAGPLTTFRPSRCR